MSLPGPRLLNFLGALTCAGLMAYALYAEHVLFLEPCPLCEFQRIAVIVLGVLFLIAAIHNPGRSGRLVYAVLLDLAALAGVGVAGRHLYLQNLPADEVPSCGPGFDYIMESMPFTDALRLIFEGSGECSEISWQFLGISMPGWVLIACLGLGFFAVWNNVRAVSAD